MMKLEYLERLKLSNYGNIGAVLKSDAVVSWKLRHDNTVLHGYSHNMVRAEWEDKYTTPVLS